MIGVILAAMIVLSPVPPTSVPGAVNPAVTQANVRSTVCTAGWTAKARPPVSYTDRLKRRAMSADGIPWSDRARYELDHRVPLEVGGAPRDPRNLWLESYFGPANAHRKDQLENFAHREVCAGKMTLAAARALFLADWRVAYRRYFGEQP